MQDNLQAGLQGHCPDHLKDSPSFGKDSPSFVGSFLQACRSSCGFSWRHAETFSERRPDLYVYEVSLWCLERLLLWCPRRGAFRIPASYVLRKGLWFWFGLDAAAVLGVAIFVVAGVALATGFLSGATTDLMERVDHVGEIAETPVSDTLGRKVLLSRQLCWY